MEGKIFIRAAANISPQKTFGDAYPPTEVIEHIGDRMNCIEPDYSSLIDPKSIRRMSRIIRMGSVAATSCLQQAGINMPDAIITGTAYGCLEDTSVFLTRLVENKEEMLTPTAFIQSTHNTVGAQIALSIKCHHYNNTFVHRGFSFESALLDAILLLKENKNKNVLVGAVDEITKNSHAILSRFGLYKSTPISNLQLIKSGTKGTMAGEGAVFFTLSNQPASENIASLDGMTTFYKPKTIIEVEKNIQSFLKTSATDINAIDLVIMGRNGDQKGDLVYNQLSKSILKDIASIDFKHLCGEYPTATGFALWLAGVIAKDKKIPVWFGTATGPSSIKKILIYNHHQNIHHSLFLLSAC